MNNTDKKEMVVNEVVLYNEDEHESIVAENSPNDKMFIIKIKASQLDDSQRNYIMQESCESRIHPTYNGDSLTLFVPLQRRTFDHILRQYRRH